MKLLEQAEQLIGNDITLDSIKQLAALQQQAAGEEAVLIGELFEAVRAAASDDVLRQAFEQDLL